MVEPQSYLMFMSPGSSFGGVDNARSGTGRASGHHPHQEMDAVLRRDSRPSCQVTHSPPVLIQMSWRCRETGVSVTGMRSKWIRYKHLNMSSCMDIS